ncbi:hypothetical protein QBC44DRAFT_369629 [Cladorrhinum sp. PSN332]|nr:hypothetical protein QBC44DRAFT_369629 [Cladorrhinum sp. PSN332]
MAPQAYIISRVADPIFAVFIGAAAAATRINREEKEKGRTTQETLDALRRYATWLFKELVMRILYLGSTKNPNDSETVDFDGAPSISSPFIFQE